MEKHKKKKRQYKKLTKDNLYRPKRLTLRNFNRLISPLIDKYNWGSINAKGKKSFHYSQDWINSVSYKSYIKLRETPRIGKYRDISLQDHLQARKYPDCFVFYTSNPYSDICMLCGDIDPIDGHGYDDCLEALHYIRNTFHPDTYWEQSTTGQGIHFYIIIDFSSFVTYCDDNYGIYNRKNCNRIIELYSQLLSSVVDSMFFCKFDKFCGTYPVYSFPFSSHIFLERGIMAKLPCPQTDEDIAVLSGTPILSYSDLGKNWNAMQELLPDNNRSKDSDKTEETASYHIYPYNILGRDFNDICKNDEYMQDNSAFVRTRNSIQKLSRELGRIPEYEEWNKYYIINECNTGDEDEQRKSRYDVVAPYVEKGFDPSLIGQIYKYGDFIDNLINDISQEGINTIVKENTTYRYTITHQDLDVGLGAHWIAVRTHMQYGKQLSVPRNAITGLFKSLKDKCIIKRTCDKGKAKAIRIVLEHMKYIKMIDPYFSWKNGDHISQRWGMDINFPKYNDYKMFCSDAEVMALNIRKMRDDGNGESVKAYKFLPQVYQEMLGQKYGQID